MYATGPGPQLFTVAFYNPNQTKICEIPVYGRCETLSQPQTGCVVNNLNISTGYNPATGAVIPITSSSYDPNWIVIQDPLPNTNEPRPASVIAQYHYGWHNPLPGSQWIAVYNIAINSTNGVYVFERCFCIEPGPVVATQVVVDLKVLADDIVDSILVCGQKMTNRTATLTNNWFEPPLGTIGTQ